MSFSAEDAAKLLTHLINAKRPVLFLGNGCRRPLLHPRHGEATDRPARLAALVDKFAIPVITTPDAKGIFPESHPMSLRHYGKASSLWPVAYLGDPDGVAGGSLCDAMLVLASSLHQLATENFNPALQPNGPLFQVDLDADVVGRGYPLTKGIVTDVAGVIDQMAAVGDAWRLDAAQTANVAARRALIEQIRATDPFRDPEKMGEGAATPAKPQALTRALNDLLPPGSHVYIDGGNCIGWSLHYMTIDPPGYASEPGASTCELHNSLVLGPMGSATAAVVGGKIARPDLTCVAFTGDGGFMMQGNEISTAAAHGAGAIWVVLDDNDLGMVSQGMFVFSGLNGGTLDPGWEKYYALGSPNLVRFAEGLGAEAVEVCNADEFRAAFALALDRSKQGRPSPQDGTRFNLGGTPQVIVVRVDPTEIAPFYPPAETPPAHS
jgi:acetolactate synthase-1/2/3 large subunit